MWKMTTVNKRAIKWIVKEFGITSGQLRGAIKKGPANWIKSNYGEKSAQYRKHVLGK